MVLKKKPICFSAVLGALAALFLPGIVCAEEGGDYYSLLSGYLEHDAARIALVLEHEQAALELRKYETETGINFSLFSGDSTVRFSSDGPVFSVRPGIGITLPGNGDSSLNVEVPVQAGSGRTTLYGVDAQVRMGIITPRRESHRAALAERQRGYLEATRNLEYRTAAAEQEFCRAVQNLLACRNTMLEAQSEVLTARYDLDQKRAGGYSASGIILRTAELKLRTRERELREAERVFSDALEDFAADCGVASAAVPGNIPGGELLDLESFDSQWYTELEQARWRHGLNTQIRDYQDRRIGLDGLAGYTWNNYATAVSGTGGTSSVNAGLGFSVAGSSVTAGISVPVNGPFEPSLTFSVIWKPSSWTIANIERQIRDVTARKEREAISDALRNYSDHITEYGRKKRDLEWQKTVYDEEAELYRLNAEEMKTWFDRGIINETDYLDARTDYLLAVNRLLSAQIDRRLYNLEVQALFVPESVREHLE
ncbi:TolC family protein [Breznakiella homolactica]|uniref:Outer membrane efflux protein n=1 Tax=Breznakiella homolactica TaxID=2798577 RepID=A0A7T8B9C3_9SPIR|nr:TolC family protein [Breznakiella homolactica]QQO09469.1 TolC family protein [Breznakiella homolactica]